LLVYLIINLILLDLREKVINELFRFYYITREEHVDQFEILKFEKYLLREELIDIDQGIIAESVIELRSNKFITFFLFLLFLNSRILYLDI